MAGDQSQSWGDLLKRAISEPGALSEAYHAFHDYSLGNQMLAMFQCHDRGILPGPICTYPGWQAKGRQVRKGEKALILCMPITCKRKAMDKGEDAETETFTTFIYKPHWFVLTQTDGKPYNAPVLPAWDRARALQALDISERPFDQTNGNVMGYASGRQVAVSPLAFNAHKTLFHEVAHILLGHTGHNAETNQMPRDLGEIEAEATAYLVCATLGLGDCSEAREYVQHWMRAGGREAIPEASAKRIFKAADQIIKAGQIARPEA